MAVNHDGRNAPDAVAAGLTGDVGLAHVMHLYVMNSAGNAPHGLFRFPAYEAARIRHAFLPSLTKFELCGLFKLWRSITVWGLMDVAADLFIRANRFRGMAARVTDEQIRMALLDLAAKYEALAREMQQTIRRRRRMGPRAALSRRARQSGRTGRLLAPSMPVSSSAFPVLPPQPAA